MNLGGRVVVVVVVVMVVMMMGMLATVAVCSSTTGWMIESTDVNVLDLLPPVHIVDNNNGIYNLLCVCVYCAYV